MLLHIATRTIGRSRATICITPKDDCVFRKGKGCVLEKAASECEMQLFNAVFGRMKEIEKEEKDERSGGK